MAGEMALNCLRGLAVLIVIVACAVVLIGGRK
jgi:hypothetical protein